MMLSFKISCFNCFLLFISLVLCACRNDNKTDQDELAPLFTLLNAEKTGIHFSNDLQEGINTNVMVYEYFYNGGGVALGDVNGDGLQDIYFTANMKDNKLYLNKGNMQFEDVSVDAGVSGRPGPWKTGVTMVDINGDKKLDIYVCYSGKLRGEKRRNELFINGGWDNKGLPHFSEQGALYGLADSSYSTQAAFFDYDRDGDLDMLLLNHSIVRRTTLDEPTIQSLLKQNDHLSGLKLFKNNDNKFIEVTAEAKILSTVLSHGLGVAVSDVNGDGWPDFYISNDYLEPDFLYINNKDGTFTDRLQASLGHTSFFSMGNNISDINNDGLTDILTLDMLPEDNHRQKLLFAPDNYEKIDINLRSGFYHQFMSNMLHVNNGNGSFSEVAQLSGISNTDWSWAPLIADYDNDGWKDLYVTNGYLRDYTNMDFLKYMGDYLQNRQVMRKDLLDLVHAMPSSNVVNYMLQNDGKLGFKNTTEQWGMNQASNSNGAAYADLDNDGDLDLVVNNINEAAFIYQNNTNKELKNHYLGVKLEGAGLNTDGIGAKVVLYHNGLKQFLEQVPSRGYQSSVSPLLHFGLGATNTIDSLVVVWQSGKQQTIQAPATDKLITLRETEANKLFQVPIMPATLFREVKPLIAYADKGTTINDFKRQPLLLNPLSFSGPCLVKGDANKDGLEDVYVGGGDAQPGKIFVQQRGGKFVETKQTAFGNDMNCEDADAVIFDANGDGHNDLYVASGGYHNYTPNDPLLQDRLYMNDGKGNYTKALNALPQLPGSKSCVRVADINGDNFPDLFVGSRVIPGRYPESASSFILINDGKGNFKEETTTRAPFLKDAGMVTDAAWVDMNRDNILDLVMVGEWMPVTILVNKKGRLENNTTQFLPGSYSGWWNKLLVGDFNKDGQPDLVIGNQGLNTQCKVSDKQPAEMYYKDFDDNGSVDPILCFYIKDTSYPYVFRDELLDQMSNMRTRFADYKSYADATLNDIFTKEELKDAGHLTANRLKTSYFESGDDGKLHEKELPLAVQFAPVFTITSLDFDKDGNEDLLFCGNMNHARLRFGKYDANYGVLLKGDGKGNFTYISQQQSGFNLRGDVRSVLKLNEMLLFGINGSEIKSYLPLKNE